MFVRFIAVLSILAQFRLILEKLCYNYTVSIFPGSSMVEQEAVNFEVTGSSPVRGAKEILLA